MGRISIAIVAAVSTGACVAEAGPGLEDKAGERALISLELVPFETQVVPGLVGREPNREIAFQVSRAPAPIGADRSSEKTCGR